MTLAEPTTPPDASAQDVAKIARGLLEAESEQIARDIGSHVGDQLHDVLKRAGMSMRTTGGAVSMGVIAAAQVLSETVEFARRSMDGDAEDEERIQAGAVSLFLEMVTPRVRQYLLSQESGS